MDVNEKILIERFRLGDESAFRELYASVAPRLFRTAFRLCGNRDDAEDVVVQTFAEAYRSRRSFAASSSLSTWLFSIAVRQCKKKPRTEPLDATMPDPKSSREIESMEVGELLAWLPQKLLAAFTLVKIEGLSYREAGEVLGKSTGTVQSQVHEASKRIRARLGSPERSLCTAKKEKYSYEVQ